MLLLLACFLAIALAVLVTDPEPAGTTDRVGQEPPRPRTGSRSHCIVPQDPPPAADLGKAAAPQEPARPAA